MVSSQGGSEAEVCIRGQRGKAGDHTIIFQQEETCSSYSLVERGTALQIPWMNSLGLESVDASCITHSNFCGRGHVMTAHWLTTRLMLLVPPGYIFVCATKFSKPPSLFLSFQH
jgi:hypothetical protein